MPENTTVASDAPSITNGEYPPATPKDKEKLLTFARNAAFTYGTWSRFKSLYKAVEADTDADATLQGTLIARVDDAPIALGNKDPRINFGSRAQVTNLIVEGEYIYALSSSYYYGNKELLVFTANPKDPMRPARIGKVEIPDSYGNITSFTVSGTLICVTVTDYNSTNNLYIVDVSEPRNPRVRGNLKHQRLARIYAQDATSLFLYVTNQNQSRSPYHALRVIDFTNPDRPKIASETEIKGLSGESAYFSVDQGLAAFIFPPVGFSWRSLPQKGGIRFVDITSPTQPQNLGSIEIDSPQCLLRHGNYTYVAVGANQPESRGIRIIDNTDPRHPRQLGFCAIDDYFSDISIHSSGDFLYLRAQGGAIYTVGVHDPAAPVRMETTARVYGATGLVVAGDLAYVATSWQGVALFSLANPQTLVRVGAPPSADTIGYMKRRGRRILRRQRKANPERYVELATEMLAALTGKDARIDPTRHWATIDVLYGGGDRYRQTKHGRGRYVPTGRPVSRWGLRTREERLPQTWDARPDLLNRLLNTADLPLPVYAFAARALRATGQSIPNVEYETLERWLGGPELLLAALAIRQAAARIQTGVTMPPSLTAEVFFRSGAVARKQLLRDNVGKWTSKRDWAGTFAARLVDLLKSTTAGDVVLSARQIATAELLARHFSWALSAQANTIVSLIAPFAASGRPDVVSVLTAGAGAVQPVNVLSWLLELSRVAESAKREPVLAALAAALRPAAFERHLARPLVFHTNTYVREAGWRLLAASNTTGEVLRDIWEELLQSPQPTDAVTTAMGSGDALGLLERAGITSAELAGYVSQRSFLVSLLSPDAFRTVTATAPASVILSLIAAAPDEHWRVLRPVWLGQLRAGVGTPDIWLAAEDALNNDATGRLESRLLQDPEITATLLQVEDERVLEIRAPEFGAALGGWVAHHEARFEKNSPLLFTAATHPLPEIRTPALERVSELGMDMPFALRLMESAVPPSVAVGKSFFDAEPSGGDREADYALALSDSPFADVRTIGIEYVQARWDTLPQERILIALFENPAPEVQAFVAQHLNASDVPRPIETPQFDAEVLRTTNRARVAKERIKKRQTAQPSVDIPTLLILARGRTPRDAEWALGELARRAAQGETIEGMTVEGTVGI